MKIKADRVLAAVDLTETFLFSIEGAMAAIHGNLDFLGMVVLAFATAVGGGTVRDLLLAQVPAVLRADVYATAALLGAAILAIGLKLNLPRMAVGIAGGLACFLLRMAAVTLHWNLPKVAE